LRLVDLTLPVVHGMGRRGVNIRFEQIQTFEREGRQISAAYLPVHVGTHVDAPLHFIKGGDSIEKVPLERLVGKAIVVDLTSKGPNEAITEADLEPFSHEVREGDIVVLRTDWTVKKWGKPDFFDASPYLGMDAAQWLAKKKIKAAGFDFAQEYAVRKAQFYTEECVVHTTLLSKNIYNIEYLTNLNRLIKKRFTIIALPISLLGLEGAPARVIAIEK